MGLDTTHGCWNGPYSAFHRWRCHLHGLITKSEPEYRYGSWDESLRRAWDEGRYEDQSVPINVLMLHSDCDGEIPAEVCGPLADALQEIVDGLPARALYDTIRPATERFIAGLRRAQEAGESVEFY